MARVGRLPRLQGPIARDAQAYHTMAQQAAACTVRPSLPRMTRMEQSWWPATTAGPNDSRAGPNDSRAERQPGRTFVTRPRRTRSSCSRRASRRAGWYALQACKLRHALLPCCLISVSKRGQKCYFCSTKSIHDRFYCGCHCWVLCVQHLSRCLLPVISSI
jgi:hypothetical protein